MRWLRFENTRSVTDEAEQYIRIFNAGKGTQEPEFHLARGGQHFQIETTVNVPVVHFGSVSRCCIYIGLQSGI